MSSTPDHSHSPAREAGRLQGIVLLLPATLAVMATAALAPVLPQLIRAFAGVPDVQWIAPMLLTVPALCQILFGPVAGFLGDRYGRRRWLMIGLVFYALSGLAPFFIDDLKLLLVSRVGVGVGEAIAMTLCTTLLSDYFSGTRRDKWLGSQVGLAALSAVAFVGVGGALGKLGWRGPFGIYLLPLLFALLIRLFTWEPDTRARGKQTHRGEFPWRSLSPVYGLSIFAALMFYVAQLQSSFAFAAKGLSSPAMIGGLFALSTLGTPIAAMVFRAWVSWPITRLLAIGFACVGLGYLAVPVAPNIAVLTAVLAVAQFGCGILLPTLITWVQRSLTSEVRGRGTGLWQGVFQIGQFASTFMFTGLAARSGGALPAFGVLGVVNLLAAAVAVIALVVWKKPRVQ